MSLLLALLTVAPVEPVDDPNANAFASRRKRRVETDAPAPVIKSKENDEALLIALLL